MDIARFKKDFLEEMDTRSLLELFEHIPRLGFWIKDAKGRLVANNRLGIQRKMGCSKEEDVIGKTDRDFFPQEMADRFLKDDLAVAATGIGIVNRLELVLNLDGKLEWHRTTKIPLRDAQGRRIGSAGITMGLGKQHYGPPPIAPEMRRVFEHIRDHAREPLYLGQLARIAGLSVRQFERRFKNVFHTSPMKFIIQFRLKEACRSLADTDASIKEIAYACGFSSPATFAAQFKGHMGMSPLSFRNRGRTPAAGGPGKPRGGSP